MRNGFRRQQFCVYTLSVAESLLGVLLVTAMLFHPLASVLAQSQPNRRPTVVVPGASQSSGADTSLKAHANVRFLSTQASPEELPPFAGYAYETPASLACVYGLAQPALGCNPNETTVNSSGGSGTIAIVDAYDDPNAAADLAYFSNQFGLPFSPSKFNVVYAQGAEPPVDVTGGWELEESLDIEYVHAMNPKAKLYLVEANSNLYSDLLPAVLVASNLVQCGSTTFCPPGSKGKGVVSMSWGGAEFPSETSLDSFFTTPGVLYFAASGDGPGVIYPCASPNVICAGGTSLARSQYTGNLIAEIAWSDAGGGISSYESIPPYQGSNPQVAALVGTYRGVPDISTDSNPYTGAWVWDSFPTAENGSYTGWLIVAGTSLGTVLTAGIFDATGNLASSSSAELTTIYEGRNQSAFRDIVYGACGDYSGSFSGLGWDLCTGFGSPQHLNLR